MARRGKSEGKGGHFPALFAAAAIGLALPSAGLAVVATGLDGVADAANNPALSQFTPATVDPQLAKRVAAVARAKGVRFTPADMGMRGNRSVTVAVRVDGDVAQAISVRNALDGVGKPGAGVLKLAPTRYSLGVSRGYQNFAKPIALPESVNRVAMPDLASFKPREGTAPDKPGRFQPHISLVEQGNPGRAPNTLQSLGEQTVDVGGAYRVMRNLNVTAGVRLSQERDRLAPLTDAVQDSQAVYVGTQFRF